MRSPAGRFYSKVRTSWPCPPEDRARAGIFLAFQYPVEIPGVNNTYFLKAALNAIRNSGAWKNWTR